MKKQVLFFLALSCATAGFAQGLPNGSGYITYNFGAGVYNYDIHLTNTGSTTIGTFWYAWNPGQDYLPTKPSQVMAPTGWSDAITHIGQGDGYAIEFTANSSANYLQMNQSLSGFDFSSTDSPAVLDGGSNFFQGANVGDSFLYHAGPFSDNGTQITVQTVPEPTGLIWLVPAVGLIFLRRTHAN